MEYKELLDHILQLNQKELDTLFMSVGKVLAERSAENFSKMLYDCVLRETFALSEKDPGELHVFALCLRLLSEKIQRREQIDSWCEEPEEESRPIFNFNKTVGEC